MNTEGLPAKRANKPKTRGPKPSITLEVVKRVSERFGLGVPLHEALASECNPKINVETWKKALAAHPELSPHYEAAKGKFLEDAMRRLASEEDAKHLEWLLERRYPELFARRGPDVAVSVSNNVSLAIPSDVLERAREIAKSDGSDGSDKSDTGHGK